MKLSERGHRLSSRIDRLPSPGRLAETCRALQLMRGRYAAALWLPSLARYREAASRPQSPVYFALENGSLTRRKR